MSNGSDLAFPVGDAIECQYVGLTKREYLAAKALQGLCSNWLCLSEGKLYTATLALAMADALIEELSK